MAVQLFDLMQLRFDPVDVMFLVNDEMFDQLTCGVVLSIEADLIPGLRTVGAACFQSEIVLGLLHDVRSRVDLVIGMNIAHASEKMTSVFSLITRPPRCNAS